LRKLVGNLVQFVFAPVVPRRDESAFKQHVHGFAFVCVAGVLPTLRVQFAFLAMVDPGGDVVGKVEHDFVQTVGFALTGARLDP